MSKKFTDRFIKVPISIFNVKEKDLTGKENLEESYMKFLPFELALYRPTYTDDEKLDLTATTVILKCGDSTIVNMPIEDFEKLLNDFDA